MGHSDFALGNNLHIKRGFPSVEKWLLQQIMKAIGSVPLRFVFEDGGEMAASGVAPVATIVIRNRRTLAQMFLDPEVAFGEAYSDGRIEVEGDLAAALSAVYAAWPRGPSTLSQRLKSSLLGLRQANSLRGSRQNVQRHYDLGNDFYRLWLDPHLVYTCAYYPFPSATLEQAQAAKLEYVCSKLRLKPGERVIEAGCGWGALALHMAKYHGVSVRAYNISHEQILFARRRAAEEGLSSQVEFIEDDWRAISGAADAFVSVGMLEHVGIADYAHLGKIIHQSIGDEGRGLLHFIGRSYKGVFSRWIRKRIFPGAYAPTLHEAMEVLQPHRFAVTDVENLRPHYARTLEHWLERYEAAGERISEMYDPWFQRAWRLYLAGSIAAFRTGTLQLFQICFSGSRNFTAPWTRASLYRDAAAAGR
jgi:cyclopropane-fatty-acyl-phospholipid synthase